MPRQTKPNAPMRRAHRAKDLVGIGKPTTSSRTPVTADLYQPLPSARIKPKLPNILDSTGVNDHTHMKPADRIGLYPMVIMLCTVSTNWLDRIYF
jgi:hypothetical protein